MEDLKQWYRGSLPASLDALKTARKSLEKMPGNLDSIRRIARSLRGSANKYGFQALGQGAELLEQSDGGMLPLHLDNLLAEIIKVISAHTPGDLPGILIVEHDAQMAKLLDTILSASDREIFLAASAGEALAILEDHSVALIILDLSLPDTDGRNFLVVLRERSSTAGVPVMVLSGMGGPQPKTECFALGADAYFEKPIAPDVLKAAVSARLHKSVEHRRESRQDALTGLSNRASFCEGFQRAAALSARKKEPLSLALLDFDLLRRINDNLGHVAGDAALRHAALAFSEALRRSDFLARWGGDEFALLLPSTNLMGARYAVEKMFSTLAASPFRSHDGRPVPLSFSAGLVSVPADASVEMVMAEADRYLYFAKTSGRGRMISESDQTTRVHHKILLAESDEQIAKIIRASLEREGLQVMHCKDGTSALQAVQANPFSLLVLELNQENMDGKSLLFEIRRHERGRSLPVLMISSLGNDQDVARGFELGASDYLVKPFTPYDLMTRVHGLLRK
jgi:two-component system, cell cycle response regulator